jgi:hypothetical protein
MTASATVGIKVIVDEIGNGIEVYNYKNMANVPAEMENGYVIVETATTTALQLFDITKIALAKAYGVYLKSEIGTIYIIPNNATTTPSVTSLTAVFILNEGEACYLPINPALNTGIKIDAADITNAFSYLILGKA